MTTLPYKDGTPVPKRNPVPVSFYNLRSQENFVFFGNGLTKDCERCGAYNTTSAGHKYCAHVACPIAVREFRRRKRARTSSLEQVYVPQFKQKAQAKKEPSI